MSATSTTNPIPLGLVIAGASFATVSVAITTNVSALASTFVDSLYIRALPGNDGNVYVCNTAANPNETTYGNVLDILAQGASYTNNSSAMNTIRLSDFFIGADNATDGVIVTVRIR